MEYKRAFGGGGGGEFRPESLKIDMSVHEDIQGVP